MAYLMKWFFLILLMERIAPLPIFDTDHSLNWIHALTPGGADRNLNRNLEHTNLEFVYLNELLDSLPFLPRILRRDRQILSQYTVKIFIGWHSLAL